jgi:TMEM164 family
MFQLPFEVEVYYVQHVAMLIVPYYLLRLGGVYTIEDSLDFYWPMFSYGTLLLYHFTVLQFIGMKTLVNLNSMVCPAISDPFYGPNYRVAAIFHQALMVPLSSKIYGLVASYFLTCFSFTKVKDKLESDLTLSHVRPSISCVNNLQKRMSSSEKTGGKKE